MFTGHRGVGKTTELKRVKRMLEDGEAGRPMFVSLLEVEQWLDLQDVQAPDIIFHMVRQLVDDLNDAGFALGRAKFEQFFGEIKDLLGSEVEFQSIKVPAGIAEFGLVLKDVPRARPTLRRLIEGASAHHLRSHQQGGPHQGARMAEGKRARRRHPGDRGSA